MSTPPPSPPSAPNPPPKPVLKPFWKWLLRATTAAAMLLFLAPTFYVLKYYGFDRPREEALARRPETTGGPATDPDALLRASRLAGDLHKPASSRQRAITEIGLTLRRSGVGWKRPLECLTAKATLADLAAKDPDPAVRAAASEEIGKVAQQGAVIRR
jgi:hypothetical protein